jgi:chromosome segregation ATPase
MADGDFRDNIKRQGEDALGKLAAELLENPILTGALGKAFDAREKAAQAQEVAMGALNLPSASDLERLTRRLRSVSQRLEGIEDAVDRLDSRLEGVAKASGLDERLGSIEGQLTKLTADIAALSRHLDAAPASASVARGQERLEVDEDTKPAPKKPAAKKKASAKKKS